MCWASYYSVGILNKDEDKEKISSYFSYVIWEYYRGQHNNKQSW